jgi:hypothetical protein
VARFNIRRSKVLPPLVLILTLLSLATCKQGVPIIDPGEKPPTADGTISGIVRGPEGSSPVEGRVVEAVNVQSGARQRVTTSNTGGFSFKLHPGKYRIELTLRDGETIVKQPGVIDLNRSDVDAHADFVIGSPKVLRPRWAPRGDDGLGSAIG